MQNTFDQLLLMMYLFGKVFGVERNDTQVKSVERSIEDDQSFPLNLL